MSADHLIPRSAICILIPAYNEEKRIAGLVRRVESMGYPILVVDDGSRDGTARLLKELGVPYVTQEINRGKGAALRKGFEVFLKSQGQALIMMDSDGQHDPGELEFFVRAISGTEADLVVGNRMTDPKSMPLVRRITNRFMSWMLSCAIGQAVPDSQCGYRAIRAEALKKLELHTDHFEIESEMLLEAGRQGLRIRSIPVRSVYEGGVSHIDPVRDTYRFFKFLLKYGTSKK